MKFYVLEGLTPAGARVLRVAEGEEDANRIGILFRDQGMVIQGWIVRRGTTPPAPKRERGRFVCWEM